MSQYAELLKGAESKLAKVLRDSKIDPVRVLTASHELESLRPEDRESKRLKKAAAGKEDEAAKAARSKKPRSGRPITDRALRAALAGKSVSGPTKHRFVRAVNHLRTQKKLDAIDLRALF